MRLSRNNLKAASMAVWAALLLSGQAHADAPTPPSAITQEAVAAIKLRAQLILEERRRARRIRLYKEITQTVGYETNPSNSSSRVGDTFLSNSLILTATKRLSPTWSWQGLYYGSFDNYLEYGDGDFTYQSITPAKLLWLPGRAWRADLGAEFNLIYYPDAGPSNYREFKPSVGLRQNLGDRWFHSVRYDWSLRDYISKHARSGLGLELTEKRQDSRHRFRYEVGTTLLDWLVKIRQEWYDNDSNDERNDFYDAQDLRTTFLVNRPLSKKWIFDASYSYERKNYDNRPVARIQPEARYDDLHTINLALTYEFDKIWRLTPSFSYKWLDSNEPRGEYVDATGQATVSARF